MPKKTVEKLEPEEKSPLKETLKKQPKKAVGGSKGSPFVLENTHKEPTTFDNGEIEEEGGGRQGLSPEMVGMVNDALIETSVKMVSKIVELITKIPEMAFDDGEISQLKLLWSPLLPEINPVLGAIVGTSIIVSGKVAVYATMKGKRRTEPVYKEAETEPFKEDSQP